jgi:hypothetical protein
MPRPAACLVREFTKSSHVTCQSRQKSQAAVPPWPIRRPPSCPADRGHAGVVGLACHAAHAQNGPWPQVGREREPLSNFDLANLGGDALAANNAGGIRRRCRQPCVQWPEHGIASPGNDQIVIWSVRSRGLMLCAVVARVTIFILPADSALHVCVRGMTPRRQLSVDWHLHRAKGWRWRLAWPHFPPSCPRIAFPNVNVETGLTEDSRHPWDPRHSRASWQSMML